MQASGGRLAGEHFDEVSGALCESCECYLYSYRFSQPFLFYSQSVTISASSPDITYGAT